MSSLYPPENLGFDSGLASAQAASGAAAYSTDMAEAQERLQAEISARQRDAGTAVATIDRQGYRLGGLFILAKYNATSELAPLPAVYRLPGAPDGVVGLANLHGNVVPVFELARWFEVTHDPKATPMLLVLGFGDAAVGIIIDGLPQRKRFLPTHEVGLEFGHPRMAHFASAAYQDQTSGDVWMEFDHQRFFEAFANRFGTN